MGIVAGRLSRDLGVGGGGGCVGYGYRGFRVCLVYSGMGYGSVGCKIEAVCGWGWIPRLALDDVELVGVRSLYEGLTCFTSEVSCAGC